MTSLLHQLGRAVFTGDRSWAWRRRAALSGVATSLAGVIKAAFFDTDIAHASMVMTNCIGLFTVAMGAYTGAVVVDDHLKRKTENPTP